ncbi:MAG: hypothetical protein IKY04_00325 [Lachnospiraceae bacterium]|nr:hypothetical protein [Lachnospiraceae bacterium]MBR4992671.1 hypothetical protein [Lachnospiraceae bacterium]
MGRIKDASVYLRTLIELFAGVILWGIVFQIPFLFLERRGYYVLGVWYGVLIAAYMAFDMWRNVPKSVDRGNAGARKHTILTGLLRYAIVIILYGLICYFDFGSPITAFVGLMGLKVAVYLQPFTHKLFMKLFSWKEIEYPPYIPEEEEEPEEDRDII